MYWNFKTTMVMPYGFVLISSVLITTCSAANILGIFPTPSYSHQQPLLAISRALALKGHNLTVLTTNPSKTPIKNHREIDLSSLYKMVDGIHKKSGVNIQKRLGGFELLQMLPTMGYHTTKAVLEHESTVTFLREVKETNAHFDLVLFEELFNPSLLGFLYEGGKTVPPIIGLSTLPYVVTEEFSMGNPLNPAYISSLLSSLDNHMTFFQRIENIFMAFCFGYYVKGNAFALQQQLMGEFFGSGLPSVNEIDRNKSLLMITSNLATAYPRPVNPNTVFVGPVHVSTPDPLPQDIQKWMDEAEDGVIYFSLGSNMKGTSVPKNIRTAFIKAFTKFPKTRVLWKWESDNLLPGQPSNVMVKKWLPQKSILAHPKLRVFISQGGLQSMQESINFGVPILAFPCFGDQDYNARRLVIEGAGRKLEITTVNFDELYYNLKEMLTDTSYKENTMRLRSISLDQPMTPAETAVWWVEYVLRHKGAKHLRPTAALNLEWYQVYMLDILGFFLVLLIILSFLLFYIVKKVVGLFNQKPKVKVN